MKSKCIEKNKTHFIVCQTHYCYHFGSLHFFGNNSKYWQKKTNKRISSTLYSEISKIQIKTYGSVLVLFPFFHCSGITHLSFSPFTQTAILKYEFALFHTRGGKSNIRSGTLGERSVIERTSSWAMQSKD